MKRFLSADLDCMDESGRIWGIETDNVSIGEDVMLFDGVFIAEAVIEQHEKGFLVARVFQLTKVEEFIMIPVRNQRTLVH